MLDKSSAFLMPVHVWWRLESQNLHRHQKNQKKQTTRCTKPAQASKKTKKTKLWASTQGWGSIDHKSFGFLVFLVPVQVLWRSCFGFFGFFDACACLVKVRVTKPAQASKKTKNQTTRCTKPAQASKKTKKTKLWASTQGWGSIDHKSFGFLGFFGACAGFVKIMLWFFWFFLMPVQVLWRSCFLLFVVFNACACFVKVCQDEKMKKHAFHQHFRPFRCIKHCKLQCFVLSFFQKPPPHGGPEKRIVWYLYLCLGFNRMNTLSISLRERVPQNHGYNCWGTWRPANSIVWGICAYSAKKHRSGLERWYNNNCQMSVDDTLWFHCHWESSISIEQKGKARKRTGARHCNRKSLLRASTETKPSKYVCHKHGMISCLFCSALQSVWSLF